MTKLNNADILRLSQLNEKLIGIEKRIYDIGQEYKEGALQKLLKKEHNIRDYELEIHYFFYEYDTEHLLADWVDTLKFTPKKDMYWGINDGNCHNTTSAFQQDKQLNLQKHCFLLHSLYDHCHLDWDDIFKIDSIYFDVKVKYEYRIDGLNSKIN